MNARREAQPIVILLASQATPQALFLAATQRDWAIWAHFIVARSLFGMTKPASLAPRTASQIATVAHAKGY